ncbi:MAG: SDR family NAD(P)-dependent oxidoreductase [Chloroflexi bacterium]|nr:SDR family NAD(P)-dependent oxidoreductase [Chloroflexota bacterium]
MPDRNRISLKGKIAFISGASKGIGVEIARNLAEAGADLALTGRSKEGLAETEKIAKSFGVDVWIGTAGLGDAEQVRELGRAALDAVGRVDILVNNAGLVFPGPVLEIGLEDWRTTYDVDVLAPLILAQAFVPGMIERGHGKVINITSRAALVGQPGLGSYSSAKAALHQLSKTMAVEFGPHNIQVNCIAPTVTMTPMAQQVWKPGPRTDAKLARIPAGRFAEPSEVADIALFLASDLSGFVNGAIIPADGGEGA